MKTLIGILVGSLTAIGFAFIGYGFWAQSPNVVGIGVTILFVEIVALVVGAAAGFAMDCYDRLTSRH